jgi:GTPase SAR1 family protein
VDLNRFLFQLSLPIEFKDKDNEAILDYLRELNLCPPIEMHRMRVMVVGPGEAGKTTLVHRMLTGRFSLGQFLATDGISMKEWTILPPPAASSGDGDGSEDLNVCLSLWDFGGQEVYLNSHPLLFSDQTLYLLVWNPRSGSNVRQLEEYVLNIRSRAKAAPIMLITTHSSEVGGRESERSLRELKKKYNCLEQHHAIDSRTGEGIEELKSSVIRLVTRELVGFSRVLVPHWYSVLESRVREESSRRVFSMSQAQFLSLCSSVWPSLSSPPERSSISSILYQFMPTENTEWDSLSRMKTVLDLFHHWGVVFVLPNQLQSGGGVGEGDGGDIVLAPQQLANVLKCVITCNSETMRSSSNHQLFKDGILVHDRVGLVWSEYEARLHHKFLCLLNQVELAYDMFDSRGEPLGCSLVPSLLPEPDLDLLEEGEVRARLLCEESRVRIDMICRGVVKIKFDSLLSNFFPKLLVRLRVMSSVADCSRRHCVVRVAHQVRGVLLGWSVACVVDDASSGLLVYPGGCSFDATTVVHQAIRGLLDESFSGMCLKDVTLSAEEEIFSRARIVNCLQTTDGAFVHVSKNQTISLRFLSWLFAELDQTLGPAPSSHTSPPDALLPSLYSLSHSLSETQLQILLALHTRLLLYEGSNDVGDRLVLSRFLVKAIPTLRQYGLGLNPCPAVLWLVGRCVSSSTFHAFGVSPSMTPGAPWEVVWDRTVVFPPQLIIGVAELKVRWWSG